MNRSIFILAAWIVLISAAQAGPKQGVGPRPVYRDPIGPAQGNDPQKDYYFVWRDFRLNVETLMKTIGATNDEAAALLRQIQTNAAFLDTKWKVWFAKHPQSSAVYGDDYLTSLRMDVRVLGALKKEKDAGRRMEKLRDVALDLQIKADNCRNSSDGLGKEIKVKVHTKAGEKEVGGYEVFFVPKGMLDVKSAHDRFPRQSSPTDEKILCPGGYAMWARKKGSNTEPTTLRIGGRGETRLEVDLPVPAE